MNVETTKNRAVTIQIDHLRFRNKPTEAIMLTTPVIATCGGKPLKGSIMSKITPAIA